LLILSFQSTRKDMSHVFFKQTTVKTKLDVSP